MKRAVSILLLAAMLISSACLVSCGGEKTVSYNTDYSAKEIAAAVFDVLDYDGLIDSVIYKEDDNDELLKWQYGLYDEDIYALVDDYAITLPTDYCQTLAVLVCSKDTTEEQFESIKSSIKTEYMELRASSLQMYMPDEYAKMAWAVENQDLVWKQYDNVLVLCVYNDEAGSNTAWNALETLFTKDTK